MTVRESSKRGSLVGRTSGPSSRSGRTGGPSYERLTLSGLALGLGICAFSGCDGPVTAMGGGGKQPVAVELLLSSKSSEGNGATQAVETVAGFGTIKGRIVFDGGPQSLPPLVPKGSSSDAICKAVDVPNETLLVGADGGLANVVVYLRKSPKVEIPAAPSDPVVIDQDGCKFLPHVVVCRVGQPLQMKNSDGTAHNVKSPYFNQTIAPKDTTGLTFTPKNPEGTPLPVACDIHAWMKGYVAVVNHPWAAVTAADGTFEITGVPAGEREFIVWHEKGTIERSLKIKVQPDAETPVELKVAADKLK